MTHNKARMVEGADIIAILSRIKKGGRDSARIRAKNFIKKILRWKRDRTS